MSNEAAAQMTRAFDELAAAYEHEHHDAVARALLRGSRPSARARSRSSPE